MYGVELRMYYCGEFFQDSFETNKTFYCCMSTDFFIAKSIFKIIQLGG